MKTKVRTLLSAPDNHHFHKLEIQILDRKYPNSQINANTYLDVIGSITFQKNADENVYYALRYVVNTEEVRYLTKMASIAKYLQDKIDYHTQPDAILKLLGAEEFFMHEGNFIPVLYDGMHFFKVFKQDEYYTHIIAVNEIMARNQFNKLNLGDASLKFSHVITLPKTGVTLYKTTFS